MARANGSGPIAADVVEVGTGSCYAGTGSLPAVSGLRLIADAVVTVDDEGAVHQPGVVDIEDGRIAWVGPAAEASPTDGLIEQVGGLLMPGLVNTHAHSSMTLLRGAGDGLPLDRWLQEAIWPRESRLTDDDVYWGTTLGLDELLRGGVTTTCEMYLHSEAVAAAVTDAGIRAVITPGIFDLPGAGPEGSWPTFLEGAATLHAGWHDPDGLVQVGFGPHSTYALPIEGLEATAKLAQELDALVQVHLSETADEVRTVEERHGGTPAGILERTGLLDGPLLAAHAVWLSPSDIDLLADHQVAVAHCPGSNAKLGSGVAPVAELRARGLRVGLGTDGPASNDRLDLWDELRLALRLARATSGDPAALGTGDGLAMATREGASALGLDVGVLATGRPADLVRLEMDDGAFVTTLKPDELPSHLVWASSAALVTEVWVAGRRVVSGGRCTTVDGPRTRREVATRARRLATV